MSEGFIPLDFRLRSEEEMVRRSAEFNALMQRRRTVRDFSDRPVPRVLIENCLRTAGSAPSGANKQPWHFVVVSDPQLKAALRQAAEEEEREFYTRRATTEWLADLAPLGVDAHKPFLEIAPYLIIIFAVNYTPLADGSVSKHYYVQESVGIATGLLITALHQAGLATLTHTPSPMKFLNTLLQRPSNERPFLILVTGYPAPEARVPDILRKPLEEYTTWL